MTMITICCYCEDKISEKVGKGVSHGVCDKCLKARHFDVYQMKREKEAMKRGSDSLLKTASFYAKFNKNTTIARFTK